MNDTNLKKQKLISLIDKLVERFWSDLGIIENSSQKSSELTNSWLLTLSSGAIAFYQNTILYKSQTITLDLLYMIPTVSFMLTVGNIIMSQVILKKWLDKYHKELESVYESTMKFVEQNDLNLYPREIEKLMEWANKFNEDRAKLRENRTKLENHTYIFFCVGICFSVLNFCHFNTDMSLLSKFVILMLPIIFSHETLITQPPHFVN